jgi:hypothetical protein
MRAEGGLIAVIVAAVAGCAGEVGGLAGRQSVTRSPFAGKKMPVTPAYSECNGNKESQISVAPSIAKCQPPPNAAVDITFFVSLSIQSTF